MADRGTGKAGNGIMNKEQDEKNAAFVYSIHLLKMLLETELISEQEFERIKSISIQYYNL